MFASTSVVSRSFATYGRFIHNSTPACAPVREVMVSQSRDLNRNTALEDWAVRNLDLKAKNVLILTNNLSLSPTNATVLDIKATLVETNVAEKAAEFEKLVLSSLPPSLALQRSRLWQRSAQCWAAVGEKAAVDKVTTCPCGGEAGWHKLKPLIQDSICRLWIW